jgi:hypothetical protein
MFPSSSFVFLGTILPLVSFLIAVFIWISYRKTNLVGVLPWILAYFLFQYFSGFWFRPLTDKFVEVMKASHSGSVIYLYSVIAIAVYPLATLLLVTLAASNVSYILSDRPGQNRFTRFFSSLYPYRNVLGICLMIAATFPTLNLIVAVKRLLM